MSNKRTSKKVYFRADAGQSIGYGHFIRSLALAEMLKEDFDCTFFTSDPSPSQIEEVTRICPLKRLTFKTAENSFLELLSGNEIVVLDNYYYTADYQKEIKNKGCRLVCIDDICERYFYADVIINHSPGINPTSYRTEPYAKLYLGADYLLLRREFFKATYLDDIKSRDSIFICFGGSDEHNFTLQACKCINSLDNRRVVAVTGGGYDYTDELDAYASEHNVRVYKCVSASKMIELMSSAALAIVPASTTFLETCCARVPIITGYTVDNQVYIASSCSNLGLGYNCGDFCDGFDSKIRIAYEHILSTHGIEYVQKQRQLINDSSDNLIRIFKDLC